MKRSVLSLAALLLGAGTLQAAPSGELVLYTSQSQQKAQAIADGFEAAYPDVEVRWIRNGTGALMNILRTEQMAGEIQADVLNISDDITMGQLKAEGLLRAFPEADTSGIDARFHDADGYFFGTQLSVNTLTWNTNQAEPITSWWELTDEAHRGMTKMPSPLYSGASQANMHAMLQSPDLGWAYFEALAANGLRPDGGNGPARKAVADGLADYAIVTDAGTYRARRDGSPVDMTMPSEGVSYFTQPVAIMAGAKNVEAAEAFVEWLMSKDAQQAIVEMGNVPLHPEVAAPEGYPAIADMPLLPLNIEEALATDAEAKERFSALFGLGS